MYPVGSRPAVAALGQEVVVGPNEPAVPLSGNVRVETYGQKGAYGKKLRDEVCWEQGLDIN